MVDFRLYIDSQLFNSEWIDRWFDKDKEGTGRCEGQGWL